MINERKNNCRKKVDFESINVVSIDKILFFCVKFEICFTSIFETFFEKKDKLKFLNLKSLLGVCSLIIRYRRFLAIEINNRLWTKEKKNGYEKRMYEKCCIILMITSQFNY